MDFDTADIVGLQACQDQDFAAARDWWNETSNEEKVEAWRLVQKACNSSRCERSIIGRLAQLGMTYLALEMAKPIDGHDDDDGTLG